MGWIGGLWRHLLVLPRTSRSELRFHRPYAARPIPVATTKVLLAQFFGLVSVELTETTNHLVSMLLTSRRPNFFGVGETRASSLVSIPYTPCCLSRVRMRVRADLADSARNGSLQQNSGPTQTVCPRWMSLSQSSSSIRSTSQAVLLAHRLPSVRPHGVCFSSATRPDARRALCPK